MVVDAEATVRYANAPARHLLGGRPQDLLGMSVPSYVHPDDVEAVSKALGEPARCHREDTSVRYSMEKRYFKQDSSISVTYLTASLVRGGRAGWRGYLPRRLRDQAHPRGQRGLLPVAGLLLRGAVAHDALRRRRPRPGEHRPQLPGDPKRGAVSHQREMLPAQGWPFGGCGAEAEDGAIESGRQG